MKRGFSLAEVMFAIGILAMALIALLNLAGSALKNSSRTENLALATDLAEREISRAIYSAMNDQRRGVSPSFGTRNTPVCPGDRAPASSTAWTSNLPFTPRPWLTL